MKRSRLLVVFLLVAILALALVACDDENQAVQYTVTFHLGYDLDDVVWNVSDDLPIFTNDGYHIVDYYFDADFTDKADLEKLKENGISKNTDIFIKWEKNGEHSNVVIDVLPKLPTCTEPGWTQGSHCADCGDVIEVSQAIPALGHEFADEWTIDVAATCTTDGSKSHHCSRCEETKDVTAIPAGHIESDWITDKDSTCAETGSKHKECTVCHETLATEEIGLKKHTEVIDEAKNPTCTETGLTEGSHCSACQKVLVAQQPVDALGHIGGEETCTHGKICTKCGEEYTTALGHEFADEWTIDIVATCTTDGSKSHHCSRCEETKDVTAIPAGHIESDWITDKDSTCAEAGSKHKECTVCHEMLATEEIGLKKHTEVVDEAKTPTCTDTGLTEGSHCSVCQKVLVAQQPVDALGHIGGEETCTHGKICTKCGEEYTTALGHDFADEWTIDTAATCTTDGSKSHHCSRCEETKDATTIPAGHIESDWITDKDSTCAETGSKHKECTVCHETLATEEIGLKKHTEVIDEAKDPTCTDTGLTEGAHCSVCQKVLVAQQPVDALGHIGGEETCTHGKICTKCGEEYTKELGHHVVYFEGLEPTCEELGVTEGRYCDRKGCNYIEEGIEPIDELGHKFVFVAKDATCTEDGYEEHYICEREGCDYEEEYEVYPAIGHVYEHINDDESVEYSQYCYVCGHDSAEDYEYEYIGDAFMVRSIGKSTSPIVNVPSEFDGLPVTTIASKAFANAQIISVKIPSSVVEIGEGAFEGCVGINYMVLPFVGGNVNTTYKDTYQYPFGYIFGTTEMEGMYAVEQAYYKDSTSSLTTETFYIPKELKAVVVTSWKCIPTGAFMDCSSLEEVYLADMRVPIDEDGYTSKVSEMFECTFDDLSRIQYVSENSFVGCSSLQIIGLPFLGKIICTDAKGEGYLKYSPIGYLFGEDEFENSILLKYNTGSVGASKKYYVPQTLNMVGVADGDYVAGTWFGIDDTNIKNIYLGPNVQNFGTTPFYYSYTNILLSSGVGAAIIFIDSMDWLLNITDVENYGVDKADLTIGNGKEIFPEELVLTSEHKDIESWALNGQTHIKSITGPSSVASAVAKACGSKFKLIITGDEATIGNGAFAECVNITSVEMQEGVTTIENAAFRDCTSLAKVIIPSSVTEIGGGGFTNPRKAFQGCKNLVEVYNKSSLDIVAGATTHGYVAYYALSVYSDESQNKLVTDENGFVYYENMLVRYDGNETNIVIPDGVTGFKASVFSGNTKIKSVTIPNSISTIPEKAFQNCTALESIIIPDSVTSIGGYAFDGCSNLKTIAFGENSQLTSIGEYAFQNCTALESIIIPDSVTSIGGYAFNGCNNLTSVAFGQNSQLTSIGEYAFQNCTALESIIIPDSVTSIGGYAFDGCSNLTSVKFGENSNLATIGECAFQNCTSLESIVISINVSSIGKKAFANCTGLQSIVWDANKCSNASSDIFSECAGVVEIIIGQNVAELGGATFEKCKNVVRLYWNAINCSIKQGTSLFSSLIKSFTILEEVYVGEAVKSISGRAFSNNNSLKKVYISSISHWCTISFGNANANPLSTAGNLYLNGELVTELVIPNGVAAISAYAFDGCTSITSVMIPEGVTSIGNNAFDGCTALNGVYITDMSKWCAISFGNETSNPLYYAHNLYLNDELVAELVIPDEIEKISAYAFDGCTSITSVTIPEGVTSIGNNAFNGCTALVGVHITDMSKWCAISFGNESSNPLYYAHNLYLNDELVTELVVPDEIETISAYAFDGCTSITSISIGENSSLAKINASAFANCASLTELVIPNGVASISAYAFDGCTSLVSVTIPESVTSIGSNAFSGCAALERVYIIDMSKWCAINLVNASSNPLNNAHNLYLNGELVAELAIPDEVETISAYAFYGCTSLTNVSVPASVASIGNYAFDGCSNLTSVTFGENSQLASIGTYAFRNCTSLSSVTIPEGVTSIGNNAFDGCTALEGVYITDMSKWCAISFGNESSNPLYYAHNLYLNDELVTELAIPDKIETISAYAFDGCTSIASISIGENSSLAKINASAFANCVSLTAISYQGTVEEWNAIAKGTSWNDGTGEYTISCTDGTIAKDGTATYYSETDETQAEA